MIPAEQTDLCDFEASLVYTARTARAIQRYLGWGLWEGQKMEC